MTLGGYGEPTMSERFWTVDEANAALPHVTSVVEQAQAAAERAQTQANGPATKASSNGHGDGHGNAQARAHDAGADFLAAIDELEREQILLRDLDRGLVDFPAMSPSGRRYWLCWVVGERAVEWWHWPEDGFAGRTPITDLPA